MNEIDIKKSLQEANDCVPRLSFEEANNIISTMDTLIIDVRETSEIEATGLIKNAVNIPKSIIDANFDHSLIKDIKFDKEVMIAGDIQVNDELENFKKIADIIDISGGLETSGIKDISKISCFFERFKRYSSLVEISSTKPTSSALIPSQVSPVAIFFISKEGLNFFI